MIELVEVLAGMSRDMPDPNSVPLFRCKSCFALYQVVKTQAGPETVDPQIACRVCNGPLAAREGQFVLKYFLLREASRLDARRARQGFLRAKPTARRQKKNASNIKKGPGKCAEAKYLKNARLGTPTRGH